MSRSVYRVIPMPRRPLGLVCACAPIPNARWHRGHRIRPNASSTMTMAIRNVVSRAHRGIHVAPCRMSGAIRPAKSRGATTRPATRYCRLRYSRIVFTARDSTHCGEQRNAHVSSWRFIADCHYPILAGVRACHFGDHHPPPVDPNRPMVNGRYGASHVGMSLRLRNPTN